MARSAKEIYEEINQEVIDDVTLGATSTSKVAEWRKLLYNVVAQSEILEGLWDIKQEELQAAADAVPTANAAWWDREIRKFQYEDELLLDPISLKYYYAVLDQAAQIVTRVAIIDQSGRGVIKIAKSGPVALSVDERAALSSYIKKIQPLGSNITLISQAADVIRIVGTVHYDPIIPLATVKTNVETAITNYLASLDFNVGKSGTFYTTYLIDAIQAVSGVVDVTVSQITAAQNGGDLAPVTRKYVPVAGYITIHPDNPLSVSINYTPEP